MDEKQQDCCTADPRIARHFDSDMASYAEAGEMPPLVFTSRGLLEMLSDVGELRPTVLELGSGSGALSVALLERGAARADGVDLSPQSVATANRRAEQAGVADRATFAVGDGAQVSLEPHDWVVLDRVICCYAHMDQLLANAIGAAGKRFVMAVPLSSGWRSWITRSIVTIENATNRLRGRPCPGFVHPIPKIERHLRAAGFRPLRERRMNLWHAAVWERQAG
jgi:magnesium-protoporphyrin O-methyltransferase